MVAFRWDSRELMQSLGRATSDELRRLGEGLTLAGEHILGEASDLVPHDSGVLQASGKVTTDAKALAVVISYDTPYAVKQHEDMTYRHTGGRTAKYLEIPLTTQRDIILGIIRKKARLS